MLEHIGEQSGDPAPLVIGGDSAGANLAAAVAMGLREEAHGRQAWRPVYRRLRRGFCCILPRPSVSMTASSFADHDPALPSRFLGACFSNYLQGQDPKDWRASPIVADLPGLSPALVVVLTDDPLRDSGV